MKPTFYIHARTGEKFLWGKYVNHGYGGVHRGATDLPADGYPYAVEFEHRESLVFRDWDDDTFFENTLHNQIVMQEMEYTDLVDITSIKGSPLYLHKYVVAAANFVTNRMAAWSNRNGKSVTDYPIPVDKIVDIVWLMTVREDCGVGSDVVEKVTNLVEEGVLYADALERSLPVILEEGDLFNLVRETISELPDKVEEYRKGKKGIASMFVGNVMRKKKGLDPKAVARTINEELERICG